jgi:hypothetical protein
LVIPQARQTGAPFWRGNFDRDDRVTRKTPDGSGRNDALNICYFYDNSIHSPNRQAPDVAP